VLDLAGIELILFLVWMYRKAGMSWNHGLKALTWCKVVYGAEDRAGARCRSRKVGLMVLIFCVYCTGVLTYTLGEERVCAMLCL
jgi:hypothetical protein